MLRLISNKIHSSINKDSDSSEFQFLTHLDIEGVSTDVNSKLSLVRDFKNPYLELVRLLRESSEIEHALMVQYLFASFSIKLDYLSLTGIAYPGSSTLLGVSIQEMKHLHSVNKFLNKLGVLPNLIRQDFPYEPDIYPFEFNLESLTATALAKYVYAESSAIDIDPNEPANSGELEFINKLLAELGADVKLNHLGSVYKSIIDVAEELELSRNLSFSILDNIEEMRSIKDQGEKEHFNFFKSVYLGTHEALAGVPDIWSIDTSDERYPAHVLPTNPSAFRGHPNQIMDGNLRQLAWLGNIHYWVILILLQQSYTDERNFSALFDLSKRQMMGPLYQLGYHLAENGCGLPFDVLSLGYILGVDHNNNLKALKLLILEAKELAESIEDQLPGSFSIDNYTEAIQIIESLNQLN